MELRNRMIPDRPRIEEPTGEEMQEDTSSTAPQVGSPKSTRTRSISASDSQQSSFTVVPQNGPSSERGQRAQHFRLNFHEDFILYSQSDTDDGTVEEQRNSGNTFLSPSIPTRSYRTLAPRPETQVATSSSTTGTQEQQVMTPHRQQHTSTQTQLPSPPQTHSMMPHFETAPGPWAPGSSMNAESRKRALSDDIPDINDYPKDRHWDDKMQEALNEIEKSPEGGQEGER